MAEAPDVIGDMVRGAFGPSSDPSDPISDLVEKAYAPDPIQKAFESSYGTEIVKQFQPAAQPSSPPEAEEGQDGFWSTLGGATQKGLGEGWQQTKLLAQATGSKLSGGDFFSDVPPPTPEVNDEATKVLNEPWSADNLFSPKKWGATIARGATASWPELGLGALGAGVGSLAGPVGTAAGGALGFGVGTGLESLLPNYQAAKSSGLDHDAALTQSLKASGVDAAVAGALGLIPGANVGIDAVKRPITDAMVKMGLLMPAGGVGGLFGHAAVTGQDVSPDDIMNSVVGTAGLGVGLTGVHALVGRGGKVSDAPATPEAVSDAFDSTRPPHETDPVIVRAAPSDVMASAAREIESPTFFSRVQQVVDEKGPEKASAQQWLSTIKNAPGVKAEEIEALNIPKWLADRNGNISKADLLAHIEENQVRVEESIVEETPSAKTPSWTEIEGRGSTQYAEYRLPGPIEKYGELKFYMPMNDDELAKTGKPGGFEAPHFGGQTIERTSPEFGTISRPANENLLAHTRYTSRIDRDGARTLFIEEMQSDWHQKGRETGYSKPVDPQLESKAADIEDRISKAAGYGSNTTIRQDDISYAVKQGIISQKESDLWGTYTKSLSAEIHGVPDAPFKTSWPELTFKRMMRYASDNGFQRIAWTNGDQQAARYPRLDSGQISGMKEFYDKIVPRIADGWAKRFGMERGETRLNASGDRAVSEGDAFGPNRSGVRYVEVSPAAATRIRMGLPLFSAEKGVSVAEPPKGIARFKILTDRLTKVVGDLAEKVQIEGAIDIVWQEGPVYHERFPGPNSGLVSRGPEGYTIKIALGLHGTPEEVYATLAHEFGHVVMWDRLDKAPDAQILRIEGAFRKFLGEKGSDETFRDFIDRRDNAISGFYNEAKMRGESFETPMLSLTPERQKYWASFEEWFAEQTARWATTSAKPMSVVDKFYLDLGLRIRAVVSLFKDRMGLTSGLPSIEMKQWLDSLMTSAQPFMADRVAEGQWRGSQSAQRSFERDGTPQVQAVPPTLPIQAIRDSLARVMAKEAMPEGAAADAAHSDRINKAYEWLTSLPQLAGVNPHIKPLQYYAEQVGLFNQKIRQDMEKPMETLSGWKRLKGKQSDAVAGLIDDWANMRYRSKEEIAQKVRRMPSKDEFAAMVKENGVSDAGLAVFKKSAQDLNSRLDDLSRILKNKALSIVDVGARNAKLASIDRMVQDLRKAPYFPFLRHGDFTVTVYGKDGSVKAFERFETVRQQRSGTARLLSGADSTDKVLPGFLAKDVEPLIGLPSAMLDLLKDSLQLSDTQKAALEQLKLDHSPESSFLHRMSNKNYTPGYSKEFIRSYTNYFFHSSRYFARAEYGDRLRGYIQETRALRQSRADATKIDQIANFMGKHLDYVMNPKADFAALRGLIFNLRLGFSPTTAMLYLTQTPLGTYPWLAAGFGDIKALAAMGRASARFANYYKSKTVAGLSDPQLKGLAEAMRQGVLDGGAAPELAAMSEGRNLTSGFGRGAASRAWNQYQQAAGAMLHLADTWNRRVAFDAGWQLAMDNPEAKYISRARERNPSEYARLLSEGWTPQEASAFVVGKHTVESTHFVYQRSHRPQLMWGKASALLMFKFWQQNMLFTLWNYPSVAARSLLVMGAMGGMMGLPFAQDFNGILKAIGWRLFGKDFDLEREMRSYVTDHYGPGGRELADSLLHGLSRNGMGIPTVLEALGHHVGVKVPFPNTDRSGAMGLGEVLPVNVGDLAGPTKDPNAAALRATQSVSGAAFGFAFDVYKMLASSQYDWNDAKRYEAVAPHWISNASRAYRWYSEGRERDAAGNTVMKFDPNDTEQMMEILARGMGYTPTRLSQAYDRKGAEREVETYWDLRHEGLLRQAWEAKKSGDKNEYSRVVGAVKEFNKQLPKEAAIKAITSEQMRAFFESRARAAAMTNAGLPTNKKNIPLQQSIQRIYPGAESVGSQRVQTP